MPCLFLLFRLNLRRVNSQAKGLCHRRNIPDFSRKVPKPYVWNGVAIQPAARQIKRKSYFYAGCATYQRSLALFLLEQFEAGELAAQDKITVIHRQVTGDPVAIELE